MISCGRVRTPIGEGLTPVVDGQLPQLWFSTLVLAPGDSHTMTTGDREAAAVLVHGDCLAVVEGFGEFRMGPRANPFEDPPFGLFVARERAVRFVADRPTLLGIGSAPAPEERPCAFVPPSQVKTGERGAGNWTRTVRMVCWSDNTEGNYLLAGETCTPSGNWSTMPPHRHQTDVPGEEAPYEEVYYFRFSHPAGFGLTWQFDDERKLDQAFSVKNDDAVYMSGGYHPVVCAPGATLYHLSFMSGPRRISQASVHPEYRYLLEQQGLENQFTPRIA